MSLVLRPPTRTDAPAMAELLNDVTEGLFGVREESEESVLRLWESPGVDLAADVRLAIAADGRPRGHAVVFGLGEGERIWIEVEGEQEADAQLLDWGLRRAAQTSARIQTGAWQAAQRADLFESRGFRLVRHSWKMGADLTDPIEEPVWPAGIEVRRSTEADQRAAFEAHVDAFADHWQPTNWTFEQWVHWRTGPDWDFSLWFLAFAGEELAGISLCGPDDGDAAIGWIDILGVRRPWRRQGLGRALLLHSFRELRGRGFEQAVLEVDAESLTRATQLYEGAGMRVLRVLDRYEREAT